MITKSFVWGILPVLAAAANSTFDYNALSLRTVGARNTLDWRIWLEHHNEPISFWHDIPLHPSQDKQIINFIVEIPRHTDGKIEIARSEPLNPIFHDARDGRPRYVESVWPHKSYPFVYGSIPQTWESPNFNHSFTDAPGDNDPVDLFDIGQDPGFVGQVKRVKVLGALALRDGGETDWKVLGIDVDDPIASLVDDFNDVDKYRPGLIDSYRDWFTYYKVPRGDALIPIVNNTYVNATFATSIIAQSHTYWLDLVKGAVDSNEINYNQTSRPDIPGSFVSRYNATAHLGLPAQSDELPAQPKLERYEQWFYLDGGYGVIGENVV
ncbi:Inorganic pyrophosphatase [Aspergillus mulundensis]|uniref:inorganic diphosphatase n=1 Tax=Aspergillus mulundensis TaxID=1810919 RepID=A0A3D8R9U2_9EURO|nr:Inorganic pyrophosphatase [Aspergillus mulundensis]RDW70678.1 Inorganic pyrophosphatase [Aspergillus mulundensis]